MDIDKVLVLSPHTDDGELGAGGTIARFVEEGKTIYYVAFSTCRKSVPQGLSDNTLMLECQQSVKTLGIQIDNLILLNYEVRTFPQHRQQILDNLIEFNEKLKPDLVLVPSSSDTHQDHQTIYNEALRAFKKTSSIWGYEHPWNNLSFTSDIFVKLEERHMARKVEALMQYKSQYFRPYFDQKYIMALAYTRGTQVDLPYVETFELIRWVIR